MRATALSALAMTLLFGGCDREARQRPEEGAPERASLRAGDRTEILDAVRAGVAVLHPTEGSSVRGTVRFAQEAEGVRVIAEVEGLGEGTRHGFHVHEYGDCTAADASSAGGHFDPEDHPHALPPDSPRHAGDMGNLEADSSGRAQLDERFDGFSVAGSTNPVIGRAVIVHAQPDTGQGPSGEAGARLACGVIGVAQPE